MTRGRRDLRAEERRLWQEVARHVRPLPGRTLEVAEPATPKPAPPVQPPARPPPPAKRQAAPGRTPAPAPAAVVRPMPVRPAQAPRPPPHVPLERKLLRALAKGRIGVEASVDLHGLTQADAHAVLTGFLLRSQAEGLRLVQVVTGKGRAGPAGHDPFGERGVLRRTVPHWLRGAALRGAVAGFDEAAPHHGGTGALYVRLRRRSVP